MKMTHAQDGSPERCPRPRAARRPSAAAPPTRSSPSCTSRGARVKDVPGADKFDVMTSALFDITGTEFVRQQHGLPPAPLTKS